MSEIVRAVPKMFVKGYIDKIEGTLTSSLNFEISSIYSSGPTIIMQDGKPSGIERGKLTGYNIMYWNEKLPRRILQPLVDDVVDRHPEVQKYLKYIVCPTERGLKILNPAGEAKGEIKKEFYSANLAISPEYFLDEKYGIFLQDLEITLGNAIISL